MAALTVVTCAISGTNPAPVSAAGGGDSVVNPRGDVMLLVTNGAGAPINVTLAAGANPTRAADGTFPAMTLANQVIAVTNGQSRLIGPIPAAFNDANGLVQITYSSATSVTIAAFRAAA